MTCSVLRQILLPRIADFAAIALLAVCMPLDRAYAWGKAHRLKHDRGSQEIGPGTDLLAKNVFLLILARGRMNISHS
jgi:hypothetical protein